MRMDEANDSWDGKDFLQRHGEKAADLDFTFYFH
jgi:hypothetical protein